MILLTSKISKMEHRNSFSFDSKQCHRSRAFHSDDMTNLRLNYGHNHPTIDLHHFGMLLFNNFDKAVIKQAILNFKLSSLIDFTKTLSYAACFFNSSFIVVVVKFIPRVKHLSGLVVPIKLYRLTPIHLTIQIDHQRFLLIILLLQGFHTFIPNYRSQRCSQLQFFAEFRSQLFDLSPKTFNLSLHLCMRCFDSRVVSFTFS